MCLSNSTYGPLNQSIQIEVLSLPSAPSHKQQAPLQKCTCIIFVSVSFKQDGGARHPSTFGIHTFPGRTPPQSQYNPEGEETWVPLQQGKVARGKRLSRAFSLHPFQGTSRERESERADSAPWGPGAPVWTQSSRPISNFHGGRITVVRFQATWPMRPFGTVSPSLSDYIRLESGLTSGETWWRRPEAARGTQHQALGSQGCGERLRGEPLPPYTSWRGEGESSASREGRSRRCGGALRPHRGGWIGPEPKVNWRPR